MQAMKKNTGKTYILAGKYFLSFNLFPLRLCTRSFRISFILLNSYRRVYLIEIMSNAKKSGKSKFLPEDLNDFINKSQYVKESPKMVKPQKRKSPAMPAMEEQAMSNLMADYQAGVKKRKVSENQSTDFISQKVQNTVAKQIESRQQCSDLMLKNMSDILTQLDADYDLMKENQEKLEQLTGALLKCIQQSNAAQKQKLNSLWEIHGTFKKGCEDMIALHKEQNEKLAEDMEENLKNYEQRVIAETKRNGWDNLRKTFFHAMQKDL